MQRAPTTAAVALLQQQIPAAWLQQTQSVQATQQQKLRLQSLQMERERLRLRQEEIKRQVRKIILDNVKSKLRMCYICLLLFKYVLYIVIVLMNSSLITKKKF